MENGYEYIDESSIDISLKCLICSDPYTNPCSTICDHTFCRSCITKWLESSDRCPACSKRPMTSEGLRATNRLVFDILDRLLVRCKACRQTNIQRGNFDEHSNRYCLKTFVTCSAADLKCPWQGPRDQLSVHLSTCSFENMRPILSHLINTINSLTDRLQQCENQNEEYFNRVNVLEIEKKELSDEIHGLKEFCSTQKTMLSNLRAADAQHANACLQLNNKMQLMQILSNPSVNINPRLEMILSQCQVHSTINLIDLRLNDYDIPFIIRQAIVNKQCSVLNLSNNFIKSHGIELLANALRSNLILKRLCLKGNQINCKGVDHLQHALLINNTLEVLDLESNCIADLGAQSLAEVIRYNRTLKDLHIGYNNIEHRGIEVLFNAMDNKTSIEVLGLAGNRLDDRCLDSLEKMLGVNNRLQRLDLSENQFSLDGKTRLLRIGYTKKGFKMSL
ncbi:unnamed protein product [Adineta ricciae]|uniref:RING-type domain-containing protein n=1 Tax=Adineta ricciae TaxID=249248 RepID=A0A815M9N7_ADIRI|nr:unnamed protein product [Adineta ricciae]